eukprot:3847140-Rhodomonas_salina.1
MLHAGCARQDILFANRQAGTHRRGDAVLGQVDDRFAVVDVPDLTAPPRVSGPRIAWSVHRQAAERTWLGFWNVNSPADRDRNRERGRARARARAREGTGTGRPRKRQRHDTDTTEQSEKL